MQNSDMHTLQVYHKNIDKLEKAYGRHRRLYSVERIQYKTRNLRHRDIENTYVVHKKYIKINIIQNL